MVHEDFYSGEPVEETGSSNFAFPVASNNIIDTGASSEVEAANMANFGKTMYDYDPAQRAAAIQTAPVPLTGGGYGGTFNPYQQPSYGGGIGAPPPWYGGGYSPYGNPQPSYGYYRPPQQQQRPEMPTHIKINPLNMSGEFLPTADWEEEVAKMQMEYFNRQQEIEAKQLAERSNSVYGYGGYGYNYYGIPYVNPFQYNSLNNEFMSRIEKIRDDARDRRLEFNMNLSRLAHNFSREENMPDSEIRERYTGKTVEIPAGFIPEVYYEQIRFANLQPFDNSQMYRDYYASLKREYDEIIPPDSDLKTTFANMAIIQAKWDMEEEQHRRKDAAGLYNSGNAYKYYVRQKAKERYAKANGGAMPTGTAMMPTFGFNPASYVAGNPVLSQAANLADDGTLNVSISLPANVGSHKGEVYTVTNSQEAEYNEKRERFGRFLDSIPGNIYLDQQKQQKMEEYNG